MGELSMGYQNIIVGKGFELAFAGMVIVFVSLALISTVVALIPMFLKVLAKYLPEKVAPEVKPKSTGTNNSVIAAIAYAKHNHLINSNS